MASLTNKVIAITGGASGIGLAVAKLLSSRGAHVSISDIQKSALESAAKEIKAAGGGGDGKVLTTTVDVRSAPEVDSWIKATTTHFGRLDGAANMAGVAGKGFFNAQGSILTVDDDDWEFVMGVNVTGLMHSMRAELKAMADGGSVVNASSVAGLRGGMCTPYATSKHAVIGLTRCAAKDGEVGGRGIRVNAIAPGAIETPMMKQIAGLAGIPESDKMNAKFYDTTALNRSGLPEEVAQLVAFLLSDESKFITGSVQSIDGGNVC